METLVHVLADEIQPLLDSPFAFFGHSMGGIVAFELARELRRRVKPLPKVLIASAARAPQFRLNHHARMRVSEGEFLEEIRRLEGMPADVLGNPELLRLALPALCVDARLYDHYVYVPEDLLRLPIHSYGGETDPNVTRDHLEAWCEQTTSRFAVRVFPGGHFYFLEQRDLLLRALEDDLRSS
jgi:surfactin synthase thioesterase subunit